MRNVETRIVEALNFENGLVSAADGAVGDIDHFIDFDGDETDDFRLACVAIVKWRDCEFWSAVELADFECIRRH